MTGENGKMADIEVAELLEVCGRQPPSLHLTSDQKETLRHFVQKNKDFRALKNIIRVMAWQKQVHLLNMYPAVDNFSVDYAKAQGEKEGMLQAIDLLETLVEKDDGDE